MDITELIGFLVSLFFLLFLFIKQGWDASARKKHPEEYARKQREKEMRLKEFMKSMDIQVDEDEEDEEQSISQIKRSQKNRQPPANHSARLISISPRPEKRVIKHVPLLPVYTATKEEPSRASRLIKAQHSMKDVIVLNEIMGAPRGSRSGSYRDRLL